MKITELGIREAFVLEKPSFRDKRGTFEVVWDGENFRQAGIMFEPSSACQSFNHKAGTLRGMHFQLAPHAQAMLVSCVGGAVWDVVVDLRRASPSYLQWAAAELNESSSTVIYVPRGCAHGYLTMRDNSTIAYLIEGAYHPASAGILRWNDPAVGIPWNNSNPILSEQDRLAPDYHK